MLKLLRHKDVFHLKSSPNIIEGVQRPHQGRRHKANVLIKFVFLSVPQIMGHRQDQLMIDQKSSADFVAVNIF